MAAAGEAASIKRSPATRQMVPCQKRNGPLPKLERSPAKRGMVPCQRRNGPLPKEEWSSAKRGTVPCQKRIMVPCLNDVPTSVTWKSACAHRGLLLLHDGVHARLAACCFFTSY